MVGPRRRKALAWQERYAVPLWIVATALWLVAVFTGAVSWWLGAIVAVSFGIQLVIAVRRRGDARSSGPDA
jgi:peptidoglycan/LPS O-acetylase OafA/YrhL